MFSTFNIHATTKYIPSAFYVSIPRILKDHRNEITVRYLSSRHSPRLRTMLEMRSMTGASGGHTYAAFRSFRSFRCDVICSFLTSSHFLISSMVCGSSLSFDSGNTRSTPHAMKQHVPKIVPGAQTAISD